MATSQENTGTFARAFLPGLVLGLIIGGVTGAVLPELIGNRPPAPQPSAHAGVQPRSPQNTDLPVDRDEQPTSPTETTPVETPPADPQLPPGSQAESPGGL